MLMKGFMQTMTTIMSLSPEILLAIAGLLGPSDVACLHLANKQIYLLVCQLDFRRHLEEGSRVLAEVERQGLESERRSLMVRLRADYPEDEFGLCEFCLKYKRYDDNWVQKRVNVGSQSRR